MTMMNLLDLVKDRVLHYVLLHVEHRQVRSSNVYVCVFYSHALEYLQSPRTETDENKFFPHGNARRLLAFLWPVVSGDTFSLLAPIL